MKPLAPLLVCVAILFSGLRSFASEPLAESKKAAASETHTVKRGTLKSKAQVDAVLESTDMQSIKIIPKAWSDLTVVDAVAHGSKVNKGDVLVRLDPDK